MMLGYVKKSVSKSDKRVCYIELTEKLKKYCQESSKKFNKVYNDCLSFLTKDELEEFNNILLKINNNL